MRSYRFSLLLLTALLCLPVLFSCSPAAERNDFAYADAPFSFAVEGAYLPAAEEGGAPRPIAATVTAGTPLNGDPTLRDVTVTFTAPATLAGVTVTATLSPAADGAVRRTVTFSYPTDYGDVTVTAEGDEFDGLLRFAEALLPVGDVVEVSPVAEEGTYTVKRKTGDGTREAVFVFARGRAFPMRVTLTDRRGRVELTLGSRADGDLPRG